jgi:cytidylate kinase
MTCVNLRGPSGSGKTTVARRILEHKVGEESGPGYVNKFEAKRPKGFPSHLCDTPAGRVWVHGRYDVAQGGCDTEKDIQVVDDNISRMVERYPADHHFFEGLMLSKAKTRWLDFVKRFPAQQHRWVWLDTPAEECARRVMSRNGGRQISVEEIVSGRKTMMSQYHEITNFRIGGISTMLVSTDVDVWSLFT